MPIYRLNVQSVIEGDLIIEAETPEEAIELARTQFDAHGNAPQTWTVQAEIVEELLPAPKSEPPDPNATQSNLEILGQLGFGEKEMCPDHDVPLVNVRDRLLCSVCQEAWKEGIITATERNYD